MCGLVVVEDQISTREFENALDAIQHRGPDHTNILNFEKGLFGFQRLSIMDLSNHGHQPFQWDELISVTNGEIYNYNELKGMVKKLAPAYPFHSHSDCEVILPLYKLWGIKKLAENLDSEFATVIWDPAVGKLQAARDPIGIRPLFYGKTKKSGSMAFSSEMKALHHLCGDIFPFPPGHIYDGENFVPYTSHCAVSETQVNTMDEVTPHIKEKFVRAVEKRLVSDAPVGFLLSGGLDSALVCSVAQRLLNEKAARVGATPQRIRTFSIGMDKDAIDLKYAAQVAEFLGTDHTEVTMTFPEVREYLEKVIWSLETWDTTTIRAGMGMYLLCKHIHQHTDIKVLLTGEVSDELFGYKYTDFAPDAPSFQAEAEKRVRELYMYDVLRADRCLAAHSLEARVPFGDIDFYRYVMSIKPEIKMNTYQMGKYLLRKAFEEGDYLPHSILYRDKAAFSDGVGHSMVDELILMAKEKYASSDFKESAAAFSHKTPFTEESTLYRMLFSKHYNGRDAAIADYWMPNKTWPNCQVTDPSARVLPNYGKSGE